MEIGQLTQQLLSVNLDTINWDFLVVQFTVKVRVGMPRYKVELLKGKGFFNHEKRQNKIV